uniref:Homeobox-domain-containing protein n=1 Tax=Mycena chlorophos TaxID=658473 RepID=A0ABQ0KZ62_MYCCL|nr:homeobox-domain-containing protein [Mycena chlorophos]
MEALQKIKIDDAPPSFKLSPDQPKLTERGRRATPRTSRTTPDSKQLAALQKLYNINPSPSIEERAALALEIGMDTSKVSNFFRNKRASKKKAAAQRRGADEEYTDGTGSASTSRAATPVERKPRPTRRAAVDMAVSDSEDEQEAVTPPPLPEPTAMLDHDPLLVQDALLRPDLHSFIIFATCSRLAQRSLVFVVVKETKM